jgi:hypothetical protein
VASRKELDAKLAFEPSYTQLQAWRNHTIKHGGKKMGKGVFRRAARMATTLLPAAMLAATITVLLPASPAAADINGCPQGGTRPTSDRVGATATVNGNDVDYTFESFVTEGSDGVPGLIEYCVYSDTQPDSVATVALGADGSAWSDPPGFDNFSFQRGDGNPSNIPYDGASHAMGTATWTAGVPGNYDRIVLHINDAEECNALYDPDPADGTCFVLPGGGGGHGEGAALGIDKTVAGSFDNTFVWTIEKTACAHGVTPCTQTVKQVGGNATFDYTVTVTHDGGTVGNVQVSGTITVNNPNSDPVAIDSLTDQLSDGTDCTITGGAPSEVPSGDSDYGYTCSPSGTTADSNTATVTWSDQILDNGDTLLGGSAPITVGFSYAENKIDECVDVSDSYAGTLGTVCVGDANPTTFNYSRTIDVPAFDCVSYDNTASFTTNDTGATGSASQTVTVCGPAKTGALTMGFWQNKNGQGIISGGSSTLGVCNSGTWLRQFAPFQDLSASATCSQVATYVYNIIKAATAKGPSMNAMLKAQMLSTALDVYFSDPALGGNKLGAPSPIGARKIDLTLICRMIDGTGGVATCSGTYKNVQPTAFSGLTTCETVLSLLTWASAQSNVGGTSWYGQVKSTQEDAKNTFDAINNQVAFGC